MTKQLERLNFQRPYNPQPVANSGHRYVNKIVRSGKVSYYVCIKKKHSRTFRDKKLALCYKFIMLLKIKSNII
jgi:hypothetical protein